MKRTVIHKEEMNSELLEVTFLLERMLRVHGFRVYGRLEGSS